jgi:Ran GTPase-activating protein (RanGAP) involved in mRNA processing and transport
LRSNRNLQSLGLSRTHLLNSCLAEFAPALYHNVSIKELDLSWNVLLGRASATLIRDIVRHNKGITKLDLRGNGFGRTPASVRRIADGLGCNTTLLEIVLADTHLDDDGLSILAQSLWPQNRTLRKLSLEGNHFTATGARVLVDRMVESNVSCITLSGNPIGSEGASFLANALDSNSLPHLERLSLAGCSITDDGFVALLSALERNDTLLFLDLRRAAFSRQAYSTLSGSLPRINALQQICMDCCSQLVSEMGSMYNGLDGNTSIVQVTLEDGAPDTFPPSPEDEGRCSGGWMQSMQYLADRNRFLSLLRATLDDPPPRGLWPHALAKVAARRDILMYVLGSKPNLVACAFGAGNLA